jgi:hypothetical protein
MLLDSGEKLSQFRPRMAQMSDHERGDCTKHALVVPAHVLVVVVRAKVNDLRGRLGQPNGSVYGSPDSRVHAGRRQTFETLIPNDNISSLLPDRVVARLAGPRKDPSQDVEPPAGLFTL